MPVELPDAIPFDDVRTYELMSRGDTKGVFQLEVAGIADASRRLKPRRLAGDPLALARGRGDPPVQGGRQFQRDPHQTLPVGSSKPSSPRNLAK